jgi:hypothetical protein
MARSSTTSNGRDPDQIRCPVLLGWRANDRVLPRALRATAERGHAVRGATELPDVWCRSRCRAALRRGGGERLYLRQHDRRARDVQGGRQPGAGDRAGRLDARRARRHRVAVRQRATAARARSRWEGRCTGEVQHWQKNAGHVGLFHKTGKQVTNRILGWLDDHDV